MHGAHAKPVQPVLPHVSGGSALWHRCGISLVSPRISSGMCGWMLTHADVSTLGTFLYRKVRVGRFPTGETNPNLPSGDSGHLLVVLD